MAQLRDYLRLVAIEYLPLGLTAIFLGSVIATGSIPDIKFLLGAISFSFVIFGYNSYNAIIDKDIDKINKPHRPLPRGLLSEKDAYYIAIICYLISISSAYLLGGYFFILTILAIALTIAYSNPLIHLKKKIVIGTLTATLLYTVFAPLLGWSIYGTDFQSIVPHILFLFFLGLPKAILKDYIDIPGDSYHDIPSMPVLFGYKDSIAMVGLLYILSIVLLMFLVYQGNFSIYYLLILVFYPFMLLNLFKLPKKFNMIDKKDVVFSNAMIILMAIEVTIAGIIIIS